MRTGFHKTLLLTLVYVPLSTFGRFYYPNFLDVTALKLKGSARKHGHCLLLTDFTPDQQGALWYKRKVDITNGFFTAFNFRIKPPPKAWQEGTGGGGSSYRDKLDKKSQSSESSSSSSTNGKGGEGMAFVLHRSESEWNAMGLRAGGLGYSGLRDAIAIEFDTKKDQVFQDPNGNHVAFHQPRRVGTSGVVVTNAFEYDLSLTRTDIPNLNSGEIFTVQVSYDGVELKIYLNDLVNPILQTKIKLEGSYWMGFSATTGLKEDTSSQHQICDWYLETKAGAEGCDDGFVGSACALDAAPSVSECLAQKTCGRCLNHIRDCRWCSSEERCVAGAVSSDSSIFAGGGPGSSSLERSFCNDPLSLVSDQRQCSVRGHDFVSMWNSFMALILALLVFAIFGRLVTSPYLNAAPDLNNDAREAAARRMKSRVYNQSGFVTCFPGSSSSSSNSNHKMYHLFMLLESTCAGAVFAVIISYCVNYSLFLLTTYTLYSIGLGFLLVFIGVLIAWQTLTNYFEAIDNGTCEIDPSTHISHQALLMCSSLYLTICGIICFMLETDFAISMKPGVRVLVYALVGIALCFSMVGQSHHPYIHRPIYIHVLMHYRYLDIHNKS
mmetsp:Transcript_18936/g.38234  ORF Transcript_18936/g.38234 Transcript_18936/m.38234 type:complete len:608 (-) Transcript_18936:908-2731(-)